MSQDKIWTSQRKFCKIHFGHLTVIILPNSLHIHYVTNLKWTHLNDTSSRVTYIMKLNSQENSLKDMKSYPKMYVVKATWFQNLNKNQIWSQVRPLKFTSLLNEGKSLLNCVMLRGAEEEILVYEREALFRTLVRSHKGGVTKPFKTPSTQNNGRPGTTKIPSSTKSYTLLSILLLPLVSW